MERYSLILPIFSQRCDDKGRGDADEGNTFIIDYENPGLKAANLEKAGDSYAVVVRDYSANPEEYRKGTIWEYSAAINRNRKILSMYTMFVNIAHQQIEPTSKKMKEEFGYMEEAEFKAWADEAALRRKQCQEGTITFEEYKAWLDETSLQKYR